MVASCSSLSEVLTFSDAVVELTIGVETLFPAARLLTDVIACLVDGICMGVVCLRVLSGTALEFNALLEHTPKFRRRAMLAPLNREVTHIEQVSR